MTLNIENNQNTVRNSNENAALVSQNKAQPQPLGGFVEIDYLDSLDQAQKLSYERFRSGNYCCSCCCCAPNPGIKGSISNQIVKCILNLIFVVGAYFTSYSSMEDYKGLKNNFDKEKATLKEYKVIVEEKDIVKEYKVNTFFSNNKYSWFDYVDFDYKCLLAYFICLVILLVFLIIEMIVYKSSIKKQKENGILQYIMIFFNGLFFIIFRIMAYPIFIDFIVSGIVLLSNPFGFDKIKKIYAGCHLFLCLLLFIFDFILNTMDKTFLLYADMNYTDTTENLTNDDKSKNSSISLGEKTIDINIKKKRLCLKDVTQKHNFKFKQVLLKGITNNHIYMKFGNDAVDNMLSISEWDYPVIDPIFSCIGNILSNIYYNILFIFIPTLFHANSYPEYADLKKAIDNDQKAKFKGIFKMYGNFENSITESRLYIFLVLSIIFLLFMLKRVYFGGTSRKGLIIFYYILSILYLILEIVYGLLSILLAIFSILCVFSIKDFKLLYGHFMACLIIQACCNAELPGKELHSLQYSVLLCDLLCRIKDDFNKLINNDIPEEEKKTEIQYTGKDSSQHTLKEYNIDGHPKYLYYDLDNSANNAVIINKIEIHHKEEFKSDDKIPDIDQLVLNE